MVLSGTIYDKIKESLDKYLFGFDKSQLNVSLYNGNWKPLITNAFPFRSHQPQKRQHQTKQG